MMNLPLLYWASEQTNDPRFAQIARLHADTTQKYFVRKMVRSFTSESLTRSQVNFCSLSEAKATDAAAAGRICFEGIEGKLSL